MLPDWTPQQSGISVNKVQSLVKARQDVPTMVERRMRPRILIVDDDRELAGMLAEFLGNEGFDVEVAHEAEAAPLAGRAEHPPDLLVLDVMLPGRSGFEVLRELRTEPSRLPVLMLTARGEAIDRILGLELGADDYLAKPFDPRELAARVRAILRRAATGAAAGAQNGETAAEAATAAERELRVGRLLIDLPRRRAEVAGVALELTGAELRVLTSLAREPGSLVSRGDLTEYALGRKLTLYDRSIDTHVSNLRRKLERQGASGIEIRAVRGSGYELIVVDPS
jgi:two-component system response regulator CpxR